MTAGVLPIGVSRLRPMRDGAIVACPVLVGGLARDRTGTTDAPATSRA